MSRLIIYGDIHGCYDELKKLRKKIAPKKKSIEVCVGDIITKGKDSIKVLDYLIKHDIKSVLGNHEDRILKYIEYKKNKKIKNKIVLDKDEKNIVKSLTAKHIRYLKKLPVYLKYDNIVILHGGLENHMKLKKLSKLDKQKILSLRYLDKNRRALSHKKAKKANVFWADVYSGKQGFVVYGHQRNIKVKKSRHAIGIDTGCASGNRLTAAIFKKFKIGSLSIESVKFLGSK